MASHHHSSREQDSRFREKGGGFGEERRRFNRREGGRTEPPIFGTQFLARQLKRRVDCCGLVGRCRGLGWAQQQQQGVHLTDLGAGVGAPLRTGGVSSDALIVERERGGKDKGGPFCTFDTRGETFRAIRRRPYSPGSSTSVPLATLPRIKDLIDRFPPQLTTRPVWSVPLGSKKHTIIIISISIRW